MSSNSIEISIEKAFSQDIPCTPEYTDEMETVSIDDDDENDKGKNLKKKQNFGEIKHQKNKKHQNL